MLIDTDAEGPLSGPRYFTNMILYLGTLGITVDSKKLENMSLGRFMLIFLPLYSLGLGDGHIPTFWLLLYVGILCSRVLCRVYNSFPPILHIPKPLEFNMVPST